MTVSLRAFTVDEYHSMIKAGVFHEDEHIELLDGRIQKTMPVGSEHAAIVKRLNRLFVLGLSVDYLIGVQDPIQLSDLSEPEPDLSILFARDDEYKDSHPTPEDIRLLIEVADSTWIYDRDKKLPRYAQAGVPEVWIVNVNRGEIEQHSEPSGDRYRIRQTWRQGEQLTLALPNGDISVTVDEILK